MIQVFVTDSPLRGIPSSDWKLIYTPFATRSSHDSTCRSSHHRIMTLCRRCVSFLCFYWPLNLSIVSTIELDSLEDQLAVIRTSVQKLAQANFNLYLDLRDRQQPTGSHHHARVRAVRKLLGECIIALVVFTLTTS